MKADADSKRDLEDIFHPRSLAIVGASQNTESFGYLYLDYIKQAGYEGTIYPVNPNLDSVLGLKTYPRLVDVPGKVDYVICSVNARLVPELLCQCAAKRVKAVHLFTGRLSETGDRQAQKLEREIAEKARKLGIRLIGPNCMGLYYPREKISFNYDLPSVAGSVGAIMQSGSLSYDFVRSAALRGVYFSKVISYGNAIDLNECDYLEYFIQDRETKLIVMYIEGVADARRFFLVLRKTAAKKPVIVLKGGKSLSGARRTLSHTASIAGSVNLWETLFRQCNAVQADDFKELIDLTVAFNFLPPFTGKRVGVIGGGGGKCVLAADECEKAGLEVAPLPEDIVRVIEERNSKIAGWLGNPIDSSILVGSGVESTELLRWMAESPGFDVLICNVREDNPFGGQTWMRLVVGGVNEYIDLAQKKVKPLVVTMSGVDIGLGQVDHWRWKVLLRQREILVEKRIPVFLSVKTAATAIQKLTDYWRKRQD